MFIPFALFLVAGGSWLVAIYGLRSPEMISSGAFDVLDETTGELQRSKCRPTIGLSLLGAGFVLQAVVQVLEITFA